MKILLRLLTACILMLLIMVISLRFDQVQTGLAHFASQRLSHAMGAELSVDRVQIRFFKTFSLRKLLLRDQHRDTLIYCEMINLKLNALDLLNKYIDFDKISIAHGACYLKRYEGEDHLNLQFLLDIFPGKDTAVASPWKIKGNLMELHNFRFAYQDCQANEQPGRGMHFNDLLCRNIQIALRDFSLSGDSMTCRLQKIELAEQSGFALKEMSGLLSCSPGGIWLKSSEIQTNRSAITSDLAFRYDDPSDFSDFIHKVKMQMLFRKADINLADIAFFAPHLYGMNYGISLSGSIRGTLNRLRAEHMDMRFGRHSYLKGNFDITGLPKTEETFLMMRISDLQTDKRDLDFLPIPAPADGKPWSTPEQLSTLGRIGFSGDFTGFINDFVAYGRFHTDLGRISTDLQVYKDTLEGRVHYKGNISAENFQIGKLAGNATGIGAVSCHLRVNGKGTAVNELQTSWKGSISKLLINDYAYSGIQMNGRFKGGNLIGEFHISDPCLSMQGRAGADLTAEEPAFRLTVNIKKAYLRKLHLSGRDSTSVLSAQLHINIKGKNAAQMKGSIQAQNITYRESGKKAEIMNLLLTSDANDTAQSITLRSDVLKGSIKGRYKPEELPQAFNALFSDIFPAYYHDEMPHNTTQRIAFHFETKGFGNIQRIFFPDFCFENGFTIDGELQDKQFSATFNAPSATFEQKRMTHLLFSMQIKERMLHMKITSDSLQFSPDLLMEKYELHAKAVANNLLFYSNWTSGNSNKQQSALNGLCQVRGRSKYDISLSDSKLLLGDSVWVIDRDNSMSIDSSSIQIKNFSIGTRSAFLKAEGKLSETAQDRLFISFSGFDLAYLSPFLSGLHLDGKMAGSASVANPYHGLVVNADAEIKKTKINGALLGEGRLSSTYDNKKKRLKLLADFTNNHVNKLRLMGSYYPERAENSLDIDVVFDDMQLDMFSPFVHDVISRMEGNADVQMKIKGTPAHPLINGALDVKHLDLFVNYLHASYTLDRAHVFIEKDMIGFNTIHLKDEEGNEALATGTILHNNFKEINFDVSMDVHHFKCLNTTEIQNPYYYGTAYLDGIINLSGFADKLNIDINAKTVKKTHFYIPMDQAEDISENSFITFVNHDQPQLVTQQEMTTDLSGIQMNFDLEVTPDAEVEIIFDKKAGDILKANGKGNINMQISSKGDFNIYGQYEIEQGDYLFTLQNIINKKFILEKGGTIVWNGNPMDALINLTAVYRLKAPLYDILQDSTYKKRVPVNCKLNMKDKLMNPAITFDIELPKSGEKVKSDVASAITTQQEMNRQVFTLLMINRFKAPEGNNTGANRVGIGSSATSELLSNQLTNWLSQISNDFDIGVDYRPGDEISSQELDVALSTQLFNERVLFEGNLGMTDNSNGNLNNNGSVAGEFTIEYKITDNGKFKAKVYNESNEQDIIRSNTAKYTQGAGLFYREEFNSMSELISRIFKKKKKAKQTSE